MNWEIHKEVNFVTIVLGENLGIQDASAFHQAVLEPIKIVQHVKLDTANVKELHTSIFQILVALSKSVQRFELLEPDKKFCELEHRFGYQMARDLEQSRKD